MREIRRDRVQKGLIVFLTLFAILQLYAKGRAVHTIDVLLPCEQAGLGCTDSAAARCKIFECRSRSAFYSDEQRRAARDEYVAAGCDFDITQAACGGGVTRCGLWCKFIKWLFW